eukprot:TRINITY_DN540_c0_g1_i2.p1 TRINITY_DN540_c0_g1~~TRINITY_DN540_c0_g1_i2.p1  ORF type:complete len:292 (-),score=50.33 TRINITY_DN540_c0_g1_i2:220-1095(-)
MVHGLVLQQEGINLFLQTRFILTPNRARQISQAFADELKRNKLISTKAGSLILLREFRVHYQQFHKVHIILITHIEDNPFVDKSYFSRTKYVLSQMCKSTEVSAVKLNKNYLEILVGLERVLNGDDPVEAQKEGNDKFSKNPSDPFEADTTKRFEALTTISFQMPTDLSTSSSPSTSFPFGNSFHAPKHLTTISLPDSLPSAPLLSNFNNNNKENSNIPFDPFEVAGIMDSEFSQLMSPSLSPRTSQTHFDVPDSPEPAHFSSSGDGPSPGGLLAPSKPPRGSTRPKTQKR